MKNSSKTKTIEESLWDSANKLRGTVEPSEYKHIVLSLIFLKFISDKFDERREELLSENKKKYLEKIEFYTMKNIFYLEKHCRWEFIKQNAKQSNLSSIIDKSLFDIEKKNKTLKGALPQNYFSRIRLDRSKLAALVDTISNIKTDYKDQDFIGRIYEYFLNKFALNEGKKKGEFYTPKCVVQLITELIEPFSGKIYDPCCGSGGMFVQSIKFIEAHKGNKKNVSIYGQEATETTYKLAKMNLAIRGINANLGESEDTFLNDQHPNLKADFILANPPFNQKDWRDESQLINDNRWQGYDIPPVSNANYAWILHMISKLSENGIAAFILANGALSGGGEEYKIRKKMIEHNLVESIIVLPRDVFYTTDISVTLWIINKNKLEKKKSNSRKLRNRKNEILFVDLRRSGSEFEKKFIELTKDDIQKVKDIFHNWQEGSKNYKDIPESCRSVDLEEIKRNDFSLVPSRYIPFIDKDMNLSFDKKFSVIEKDLLSLLKEDKNSNLDLEKIISKIKDDVKN